MACDGANSPIREMMGLGFDGRVFEDNFLIADIRAKADFPIERRFWFDPAFNPGQTALMHRQPDDVWRLDFQLGWDIDRKAELNDDKVRARVRGLIGEGIDFNLVWTSIYTFRCCTMDEYVHGPVIFAGDSAHQVSPFGARGCNGGIQDADNLAWKLDLVCKGAAPKSLIDSYHLERKEAGLENIKNSSRSADFLTPRSPAHALFRDAVLDLVEQQPFARPMVNSGRLSSPCFYAQGRLFGEDALDGPLRSAPGSPAPDCPVGDDFLLGILKSNAFMLLSIGLELPHNVDISGAILPAIVLPAKDDLLRKRYLGDNPQAIYLIRPDQHVAARWAEFDPQDVARALKQSTGRVS